MKLNKIELTLVIFLILVGVIFALTIMFSIIFSGGKKIPLQTLFPSPTIVPLNSIESVPAQNTSPHISYDPNGNKKLQEYIQDKNNVPAKNKQLKINIINSLLSGKSGILYQSYTVEIDYVKSADAFQGMIKTTNIDLAKKEAVAWFIDHGFDQNGVCKLPLMFYLNDDVLIQLQDKNLIFNTLPP